MHITLRRLVAFASVGILAFSVAGGRRSRADARRARSCSSSPTPRSTSTPSLGPAEAAVTEYGKTGGFDVTTVEGYKQEPAKLDLSFLTPEYLAQFDGLMMMTNGNLPLSDAQKKAIVDFVRNGKALIGVALRVADALRLSRVRRDARRLLPPLDRADEHVGRRSAF